MSTAERGASTRRAANAAGLGECAYGLCGETLEYMRWPRMDIDPHQDWGAVVLVVLVLTVLVGYAVIGSTYF